MAEAARSSEIESRFTDPRWRLNNLYTITDKQGKKLPFRTNTAQERFLDEIWYLNVILKARQLGFTTLIDLLILDDCMFNSNARAGIIAHTLEDAKVIFRDKARYPYDQLEEGLKSANPAVQDSANTLTFGNNSSIRVGTSLRSGTLQKLHVSEYGKIGARYPEKAKEIRTGALNTVAAGQMVFIESTAEGREGEFFQLCQRTQELKASGKKLTELDFKFHFFPWWQEPSYTIDDPGVVIDGDLNEYFAKLASRDIELTTGQKTWYAKKLTDQQDDMKKEFPSTPEDAFEAAIEGAYYAKQITQLYASSRITGVPYDPMYPVNTFWDIGVDDQTSIWFHQFIGLNHRFIKYYENSGEGAQFYADYLLSQQYTYGRHYLPHDAGHRSFITGKPVTDTLKALNIKPLSLVPVTKDLLGDIQTCRNKLPTCMFDEAGCASGIGHLSAYRREWDEKLGVWKDRPRHDGASHGADAYRTFAIGFKEDNRNKQRPGRNESSYNIHGH